MGSSIKPFSLLLIASVLVVGLVAILLFNDKTVPDDRPSLGDSQDIGTGSGNVTPALYETEAGDKGPVTEIMEEGESGKKGARVLISKDRGGEAVIHGRAVLEKGFDLEGPVSLVCSIRKPPFSLVPFDQEKNNKNNTVMDQAMLDEARSGSRARTGADGGFSIAIPKQDAVYLVPDDDFLYLSKPRPLSWSDRKPDVPVRLILSEGGVLEGTVVCSRGNPVPGATVTLREKFDPMIVFSGQDGLLTPFTTTADKNGRFRFQAVPCRGEMIVDAMADGFSPCLASRVSLRAGKATTTEVVLPDAASISGIVLDQDEKPVADISVMALKVDDLLTNVTAGDNKLMERKADTEKDGTFRFDALAPGSYQISLNEPGFLRATIKGLKLAGGESHDDLKLVLDRGLALSGRIVRGDGKPAAKARVKAFPHFNLAALIDNLREQETAKPVLADAEGRFCCQGLRDVKYDLEITWEGTADNSHTGFRPGDDEVLIRLKEGGAISGIVVSAIDGEPVQEYTIFLDPAVNKDMLDPYGFKSRIRHKEKDELGRFEIAHVKPDRYNLTLSANGFATRKLRGIQVEEGESVRGLMILMPKEAAIAGTVYDSETREPVEGASVSLKTGIENLMERFRGGDLVVSDESGRFRFGRLDAGPVKLIVSHQRYEPLHLDRIVVMEGETVEGFELFLTRGAVIKGHVYGPDGRPVSGASLIVSTPTASTMKSGRTDGDGFYEISGLPPGSYQVTRLAMRFDMDDDFLGSLMSGLDIKAVKLEKDQIKTLDFRVNVDDGSRVVTGVIRDAGDPVKSAFISAVPVGGGKKAQGRTYTAGTDTAGRYLFKNMEPGDYTFRIVRTDGMVPGSACETVFRVKVPDRDRYEYDMDLPGGSIEGIVIDRDSLKRLPQVRIQITRSEGTESGDPISDAVGGRIGEIYSDSEGRFRVRNLREGTYELTAGGANMLGFESGGYARSKVPGIGILKGQKKGGLRIELEKGGVVEGTLTDRKGRPVAGATIYFQQTGEGSFEKWSDCLSDSQGEYRFAGLREGSYTAAVKHKDHAITLVYDVSVRKEKTSTLDLTLQPGAAVTVRVQDEKTGDPLTGVILDLEDGSGLCLSGLIGISELMEIIYSTDSATAGQYPLGRYAPGVYHLKVSCPGYTTRRMDVEIAAGDDERFVTVKL